MVYQKSDNLLICFCILLLHSNVSPQNNNCRTPAKLISVSNIAAINSTENHRNVKEHQDLEIDELIRSIEQHLGDKKLTSKDMREVVDKDRSQKTTLNHSSHNKNSAFVYQPSIYHMRPNLKTQTLLNSRRTFIANSADSLDSNLDLSREHKDKRKIYNYQDNIDQFRFHEPQPPSFPDGITDTPFIRTSLNGPPAIIAFPSKEDVHSDTALRTEASSLAGLDGHAKDTSGIRMVSGYRLPGLFRSSEDFERKMVLDQAIAKAADMIRKLAFETRSEVTFRDNQELDPQVLDLATNVVKQVAEGASGDVSGKLNLFGQERNIVMDDYLRSSIHDSESQIDFISNSGFDYVKNGVTRSREAMEHRSKTYEQYFGHASPYSRGRCDSCDKYHSSFDGTDSSCKDNDPIFKGRAKCRLSRGKIYHLQLLPEEQSKKRNAEGTWEDKNKLYNFNKMERNKFIDLGMNCTNINETKPDCIRLNFDLVAPKEGDPVPLWFVRDYLSQGHDLAVDMHDRARSLQSSDRLQPVPHSPSMLQFLNNRASDSVVKLNQESQIVLFGTKVLQEKLFTDIADLYLFLSVPTLRLLGGATAYSRLRTTIARRYIAAIYNAMYNITPNSFLEFLQHHGFRVTGTEICRGRKKRCNSLAKFRSLEGSCNNARNPTWGQSNTAFVRILPARYSDGIYALPLSVSGNPLPNPRTVSTQLFSRRNAADSVYTLALMQWGQILAHDFARQVIDQTVSGGIECCDTRGSGPLPKSLQHHSCLPIVIPSNDKFYTRYRQSCMNFVRSMTVAREDCSLGPANQLNGVSSFLDLSPVYGADQTTGDRLREFRGGRMRIEIRGDRVMMPTSTRSGFCDARTRWDICFETGDVRTNQNPQLIVLQTLLIREHNRIAYEMASLNPHWDDERLFQESRRIVIAEYQHITYRYWLPLVLGEKYCKDHNILSLHEGLTNDYDARINPSTINSFTSAAFRFLHSMIEGNINMLSDNYLISNTLRLSNHYFRPQIVELNNNFEALLRGLAFQTMQKSDANFHEEITEYLFRSDNEYGMDLEVLDIQRSRDHGIPGYNAYRETCHIGRAEDFHGLINEISLRNIEKLQDVYEYVDDIDLLVGATLETKIPNSILGPTLQCLIGEQFYRARVGDKYFYSNENFPHSFTPEQFEEIKKASLATLFCDLGEAMYEVQINPFKVSSYRNPLVPCFNLPKMNLEYWKEERYY